MREIIHFAAIEIPNIRIGWNEGHLWLHNWSVAYSINIVQPSNVEYIDVDLSISMMNSMNSNYTLNNANA